MQRREPLFVWCRKTLSFHFCHFWGHVECIKVALPSFALPQGSCKIPRESRRIFSGLAVGLRDKRGVGSALGA